MGLFSIFIEEKAHKAAQGSIAKPRENGKYRAIDLSEIVRYSHGQIFISEVAIDRFKEKGYKGGTQQDKRHTQTAFPPVGHQVEGDKKKQGQPYTVEYIYLPDIHIEIAWSKQVEDIGS